MARYDQNAKVYQKWTKEGRGQGEGVHYKPWLHVYNVPSSGRSNRVWSFTTNRVVHCMSDLEFSTFLILDWSQHIIDIREQYPLVSESTRRIADSLGFRHPAVRGEHIVMTSDFFVSVSNAKTPYIATQVKPFSELKKPRVREKLAIEKAYWEYLGIPFEIVTEKSLEPVVIANIKWLMPFRPSKDSFLMSTDSILLWQYMVAENPNMRLIELAKDIDKQLKQALGTSLQQIRQILAQRKAKFDMKIPFFDVVASQVSFVDQNKRLL
jgi:hypothetical protein